MIFLLFFSIERQISVCVQCSACFFCAILKYIEYKELFSLLENNEKLSTLETSLLLENSKIKEFQTKVVEINLIFL